MFQKASSKISVFLLFFFLFFRLVTLAHAVLEALDSAAKASHQLRNLLSSEEKKHHQDNENYLGSTDHKEIYHNISVLDCFALA